MLEHEETSEPRWDEVPRGKEITNKQKKHMNTNTNNSSKEPLYVPLCSHQDYIGNRDLDPRLHEGFTVGKRGRIMYFLLTWHLSGHATIYSKDYRKRWVHGDTMIKIHFK